MKKNLSTYLLFLFCLAGMSCGFTGCAKDEVETTGIIYGIVNDFDNGEPIANAHVSLNPGGKTANTGSDGRYEFPDMEPGQYTIQISKASYKTNTKRINVVAGQTASGDMMLRRGEASFKLSTDRIEFDSHNRSQTFSIINTGTSGPVSWTLAVPVKWITATPTSGVIAQGESVTIAVDIDNSVLTEDATANLLIQAEGETLPLEINATAGDEGEEEHPSAGGGTCGSISSPDSEADATFLSCRKSGDNVVIEFSLTNCSGNDWLVWFDNGNSIATDNAGYSYRGTQSMADESFGNIAFYNGKDLITQGTPESFLKDVPARLRVVIPNVAQTATSIESLVWKVYTSQPKLLDRKEVRLTNVKW